MIPTVPITVTPTSIPRAAASASAPIAQVREAPLTLRTAPGRSQDIFAFAQVGETFTVTARTADSAWLEVCCVKNATVWLSAEYVTLTGAIVNLPVKP